MADSVKSDLTKLAKSKYGRPWLAVAAELPASVVTHTVWGESAPASAGLTLAAGGVTAATWLASRGIATWRRALATASAAAGSGYLLVATVTDPTHPGLLTLLGVGGGTLAGAWNVTTALRQKDGTSSGKSETGVLVKAIGEARAKLRRKPEVEPNKVSADLQLAPGEMTVGELGGRIEHIAGELGVSPTAIRIVADPDNASRATLVLVPQDMLVEGTPWPGPSSPGGSITEPVHLGVYEDGEPLRIWFPYDAQSGRNATHFLAAGMNGSGKSAGISVGMVDVLSRRDVIVWAIDPSKGMQTFAPFLPYLDWVEMTARGGERMIKALSGVITARAHALGEAGFKNWTPEAFEQLGMPYMVVWIEEAAKFFRDGTEMEGLVMEARSAGISVIISLQRPSASSMPTDVREQLGGVICWGVKGGTTADMALPEDVRDAGARPEAWENRKPGYCYVVAPGVPEERYAMRARTYIPPSDDEITGVLALAPRPPADPVTAQAAGKHYAERTRYTHESLAAAHALGEALEDAGVDLATLPGADGDEDQEAEMFEEQAEDEVLAAAGMDGDLDDAGVDPDREIPPAAVVWRFGQPTEQAQQQRELTTEEAEAELLALLAEFRKQGRELVGPKDFQPYWGKGRRLDRSRSWLSPRLADLAERRVHLEETGEPGVYRLLDPEPVSA